MKKYIVILIIIIILYYIQKYCIKSEVEKILITKEIIEKFTDVINNNIDDNNSINLLANIARDLQNGGLRIFGNIILKDKHKLSSDGEWLRLTDISNQPTVGMSVSNLTVTNQLTANNGSNFSGGRHYFRDIDSSPNINRKLRVGSINGTPGIYSEGGDIAIGSQTNQILLNGNTNITGTLTVGNINKKPILTKIVTNNSTNRINTNVNYTEYTGVAFSGYDYIPPIQIGNPFEFNIYKNVQDGNWYIFFTTTVVSSLIRIRLTFFHNSFIEE